MKNLLKLEELAELLTAGLVSSTLPFAWWWLPALFFAPDLSMLGYLAGPRMGAACYNLAHHKGLALALGMAGTVLLAHAAFDRLLGYGLKYTTGFGYTHLGTVGKAAKLIAVLKTASARC